MSPRRPEKEQQNTKEEKLEVPQHLSTEVDTKQEAPQTYVIKTELDAYISERLQTQPKTLDDIRVKETSDFDGPHVLSLPKEVDKCFKSRGLSPRWINKDKRMIDRALNIRGWVLVNRVYFPELPKHLFTANGTIENGDSILGFMPASNAEKLRRRPGEISQERIKNLPIEKYKNEAQGEKINYYKPALTAEKDGEMVTTGIQPDKPIEE